MDDTDDEKEEIEKSAADEHRRREKACLDRAKVLAAIDVMRDPHKLPALFNDGVRQQWQEWHDTVPTTLEQVPLNEFVLAMPRKCKPTGAAEVAVTAPREQVELMAFRNEGVDGVDGVERTKRQLERAATAVMERTLYLEDVPIGSTVAMLNGTAIEDSLPEGERTPFLMGDIQKVEVASSSTSSSSSTKQVVTRVLVWYRMPYSNLKFVDDPNKPWKLACLCRQEYNGHHERFTGCRARRDEAPCSLAENTTRYLDWFPANQIFETKLKLNEKDTINIVTKRRLVETDPTWRPLLKVKG